MKSIDKFINDQLSLWPLACDNFRALRNVQKKKLQAGGLEVVLQYNPSRIISSAAKTDEKSIRERKCFLCAANRPKEQTSMAFEGRKGRKYDILVNPYPIFSNHIVVASDRHVPQSIYRRYVDMLDFARKYENYTVFYNGPECGASAPDHLHFQAAKKGQMPLEKDVERLLDLSAGTVSDGLPVTLEYMTSVRDADVFHYRKFLRGIFVLRAATSKSMAKLFYRLIDCAAVSDESREPMFNLFTWYSKGEYRSIVIFRQSHRSHHYFSEGEDHLTMSPGCADMAGFVIVPVASEFEKIDSAMLGSLFGEVSMSETSETALTDRLTRTQPEVSVGIMSGDEIAFEIFTDGAGRRKAVYKDGKVEYDGSVYDELFFEAKTPSTMFAEPSFRLYGVTIGKGFHWERKESQTFGGALKIVPCDGRLTAINLIGVEDYLVSVISSEMKSTASEEFLKAHAVISRSWIMSRINGRASTSVTVRSAENEDDQSVMKWYGNEEHDGFDVCADDHCQRYYGLTRATEANVRKAVDATWGEILVYDDEICDTRFSKCCGGIMEKFSTCWENKDYAYLKGRHDAEDGEAVAAPPDEEQVRRWILGGDSGAFCGNVSREVLSYVLNGYDLETDDYFRWKAEYDVHELSMLFKRKSGLDIGEIKALEPLERGVSGRICRLKAVGSHGSAVIGKELEIRRVLSESHLKSSAFFAEFTGDRVILYGAGWGHGVGLCQIGAAEMAHRGCTYDKILGHYYPGAVLSKPEP